MKWEMEMEAVETVLERIWDLHDRISDAIHAISRAHFLKSIKTMSRPSSDGKHQAAAAVEGSGDDGRSGFVFVKGFRAEGDSAMAEARSLNAIRTALENLEDQLEFFHTVQLQQRAERDAAIARLEQSRIILAMRLADHQGQRYKVIEEALAFVGEVHDACRFVTPENLYEMARSQPGENLGGEEGNRSNFLMQMLISCLELAKNSLKLERIGGVLGNASLFTVSMLALLQLRQLAFKSETSHFQQILCGKRNEKNVSQPDNSSHSSQLKRLDVFSARG